MLNISRNPIRDKVDPEVVKTFDQTSISKTIKRFVRWSAVLTFVVILLLFVPWTQNISGYGKITNYDPAVRPQDVQSPIPGKITRWFVREGDTVQEGDTLAYLSEVDASYLDPNLLERIDQELNAKVAAAEAYLNKANAQADQVEALQLSLRIKRGELDLKIQSDSADFAAARVNYELAGNQYKRADTLYREGIKSKYELEQRLQSLQEAQAKLTSAENQWRQSKAARQRLEADYAEYIAKARSEQYTAISHREAALAEIAKLQNRRNTVEVRQSYHTVRAPQEGVVSRIYIRGIGENISAGTPIAELFPTSDDRAVEIHVRAMDMPLLEEGHLAQIEFEGFPALAISGKPDLNFGTYSAHVAVVSQTPEAGGTFRILLRPSEDWPDRLPFGTGARAYILLDEVPVWYEIWRQINGFPAESYDAPQNPTSNSSSSTKSTSSNSSSK
ncbi:HlyD family secretion protein [Phaeocystidibacter marisrubri]|uniref:HlyD family efflux transporter periplasmic adaptor subunit n=1 Tax=Phaeocystidibacter marisrubri TaxID=1577780 RepID=A0A6L3ZEG7_9FLAO|nr:HlyD family efflux transporter periplasmic adaptor subunit [Phaeocystidibacter marisrubri]KAB2815998.1 HlyD family efflux transporter periplasmic adaptor subunit [Phaeocystidibacter marisrubri]GGH66812.1 biotin attachment protein [Phaeocystidibacter marisrubri]